MSKESKTKNCKEKVNANWAGREKLFYCKTSTVGMNKKDFPKKPVKEVNHE